MNAPASFVELRDWMIKRVSNDVTPRRDRGMRCFADKGLSTLTDGNPIFFRLRKRLLKKGIAIAALTLAPLDRRAIEPQMKNHKHSHRTRRRDRNSVGVSVGEGGVPV
jgi:hypothetical protein